LNRYYIGESIDVSDRLLQHNSGFFKGSYTTKANDWILFLTIECSDIIQARKIESFIKKMKNRSFIEKLKAEPNMIADLLCRLR
jgi:putative endonuclease